MELTEIKEKRIAHTLFMDFVGYSRLPAQSQASVQVAMQTLVQSLEPFQKARSEGRLMVRRTGDGMALVFFGDDIEEPLRTAMALDDSIKRQTMALRESIGANFRLRMGIHTGPVVIVDEDGDGEMDVAGEGINVAQRVMDCGDEGHILVSSAMANALLERAGWSTILHDLGVCRVKHEDLVHLYNLYATRPDGTTLGSEPVPKRIHESRERAKQLSERDAKLAAEDNKTAVVGFAWRAVTFVLAFLAVGAILLGLWRYHSTSDVKRMADALRQARKKPSPSPESAVTLVATPIADPTIKPSTGALATVPNLMGLTRTDAATKLAALGLKLALSEQTPSSPSTQFPKDAIVAQSPEAGAPVVSHGTVYVTLSSGAETPAVQNEAAYTGVLIDARTATGFQATVSTPLYSSANQLLYTTDNTTNDPVAAVTFTGMNPLRITAVGVVAEKGLVISDDDIAKLQLLTDMVRAKTAILHP